MDRRHCGPTASGAPRPRGSGRKRAPAPLPRAGAGCTKWKEKELHDPTPDLMAADLADSLRLQRPRSTRYAERPEHSPRWRNRGPGLRFPRRRTVPTPGPSVPSKTD
ncbi:hypothetical protein CELD12_26320 [Cellulomonas sp. NTE-D12]|nr:hypothetical protein CELD12_26320 [Cellulomonas sp. NTE-D12]